MSDRLTSRDNSGLLWRILFIASVILAFAMAQFKGLGPHYYTTVSAIRDWATFGEDFFIKNSLYLKGSVYHDLIRISGLPVERDDVGMLIHLTLSAIAVASAFAIFRRHLRIEEPDLALAAVMVCCFLENELILGARASVISPTGHNPAGTGQALSFLVLLLLLERRMLPGALLMTAVLAITPRANFILPPLAFLYIILNPALSIRTLWVLVIPFGYVGWKTLTGGGGDMTFEDRLVLSNALIERGGDGELVFEQQPWQAWLLFLGAAAAFPWLVRRVDSPDMRSLGWATWVTTIAVAVFGTLYTAFLYRYLPDPKLILLSAPRAMRTFTFLAAAMVIALVIRSTALVWYEKLAASLAIVILKTTTLGIMAAGALIAVGIALPRALRTALGWKPEGWPVMRTIGGWRLATILGLAVAAFFLVRLPVSYSGLHHVDRVAYREIGAWSLWISADPETWASWRALADVPGDFEVFALYRPLDPRYGRVNTHVVANVLGRKRSFTGEPGNLFLNASRLWEALARELVGQTILTRLVADQPVTNEPIQTLYANRYGRTIPIGESLPAFLAKRNARILAPSDIARLFTAVRERRPVGAHVLLTF